jgi:protein-disulfide isomerase
MAVNAASGLRARLLVASLVALTACGSAPGTAPAAKEPQSDARPTTSPELASEDDAKVPIARDDAVRGSRLAPVTMVVFSDFECPYCAKLEATLHRLREEYGDDKLRVVFKHHPLSFHPHARLAADVGQGVLDVAGQEAFWRYHATLFREQVTMSAESIRAAAASVGVDAGTLERGLSDGRWAAKVDRDLALAKTLQVRGAPGSFLNGVFVSGAQAADTFRTIIASEIEKAGVLLAGGVQADAIYTRLTATNFTPSDDDEQEAAAAAAALAAEARVVHKIPIGASPSRGPSTALVTIVEFADFQCGFCKRAEETLARIRREYGDRVRFVWRDLTLDGHQHAEPAAELARAARAQKGDAAFWALHDLLFESQPNLEDADLERLAGEAKLDVPRAMAAVHGQAFKKGIESDLDFADDVQVDGTPCFFVNGRRIAGAQSFETFKPIVDEEVAKAESLLRAGTAPAALYDTLVKDGRGPAPPEKRSLAAPHAGAPFRGAANAKIVIQEVGDFQCPFCARADAVMDQLLKTYPGQLKIVWRDKPLSMHPDAPLAAEAAREAFAQKGAEGFERMHKLLFANPRALKRDDLEGYAGVIGLDLARFRAALDAHTHKPVVDADDKVTTEAGVRGTPAFFVGPYFISGAQPFARFRRVAELAGATSPPAAATKGSAR